MEKMKKILLSLVWALVVGVGFIPFIDVVSQITFASKCKIKFILIH